MNLSIIIPTLNEEEQIERLLKRLFSVSLQNMEVIIVDGGSTDKTLDIASSFPVILKKSKPSRAIQMNTGAKAAQYENLYFVHADTLPPIHYQEDLKNALKKGFPAACYRSKYDTSLAILKLNAFFTRFYWLVARGGDQSLLIKKTLFKELGCFDENMEIMEEYPLIKELMYQKKLYIIPKAILISTRKYDNNSWFRVSRANYIAFSMFKKGIPTQQIKKRYLDILK